MSDHKGIFERFFGLGEEIIDDFTTEFSENPKFATAMGRALSRVLAVKKTLDKNMQFAFNMMNLPTKADYSKLYKKLDNVNRSVAELENRIDDLVVKSEHLADTGVKIISKKAKKK